MDIITHAKFHLNRLMLTLIFGIRASEPPPPLKPGEPLKRPGLIGLKCLPTESFWHFEIRPCIFQSAITSSSFTKF